MKMFVFLILIGIGSWALAKAWVSSHNKQTNHYIDVVEKKAQVYSDSAKFYQHEIDLSYRGKGLHKGEKLRSVIFNRDRCNLLYNRYINRRNELAKNLL
jgi:hypothetical protein